MDQLSVKVRGIRERKEGNDWNTGNQVGNVRNAGNQGGNVENAENQGGNAGKRGRNARNRKCKSTYEREMINK